MKQKFPILTHYLIDLEGLTLKYQHLRGEHSFGVQNEPNDIYTFDLGQPMSNISSMELTNKVRL